MRHVLRCCQVATNRLFLLAAAVNMAIYIQGQKGCDEFAFRMFPYARDRNTVGANDTRAFPDPYPVIMLNPCNKNDLWIFEHCFEGRGRVGKMGFKRKTWPIGEPR